MEEATKLGSDEQAFRAAIDANPHDDAPRLIFADWLMEHDREEESNAMRAKPKKHGRTLASINPKPLSLVRHGRNAAEVGEVFKRKGQRYLVTSRDSAYVSDDHIEDNDAWHTYDKGPGHYTSFDAVPVEDTAAERKADQEAQEKADAKAKADAEAKQTAEAKFSDGWAPVAHGREVYDIPGADRLKWEMVKDERTKQPMGYYGNTYEVATLADGSKIGRHNSTSYDDWRTYYHVPPEAEDAVAKLGDSSKLLSERTTKANQQQEQSKKSLAEIMESARSKADGYPDVKAARQQYLDSGDEADLAKYHDAIAVAAKQSHDERTGLFETAASEWMPKIVAEFGQEAADKAKADVWDDVQRYSHTDSTDAFESAMEDLSKERKESEAKEKAKAARKADPMVVVTGNTYPHRDSIGRIPGSKLSKLKGGWTWKVPQSKVGMLPKGLRWE